MAKRIKPIGIIMRPKEVPYSSITRAFFTGKSQEFSSRNWKEIKSL